MRLVVWGLGRCILFGIVVTASGRLHSIEICERCCENFLFSMGKAIQFSQKCSRRRVPPNSRGATATVRLCPLRALRPPPTHATHMLITTLTQETQKSENQKSKMERKMTDRQSTQRKERLFDMGSFRILASQMTSPDLPSVSEAMPAHLLLAAGMQAPKMDNL